MVANIIKHRHCCNLLRRFGFSLGLGQGSGMMMRMTLISYPRSFREGSCARIASRSCRRRAVGITSKLVRRNGLKDRRNIRQGRRRSRMRWYCKRSSRLGSTWRRDYSVEETASQADMNLRMIWSCSIRRSAQDIDIHKFECCYPRTSAAGSDTRPHIPWY